MKPRNKYDKNVNAMAETLPGLTDMQVEWMKSKFKKCVYATNHKYTCLECTHVWETKNNPIIRNRIICPKCGEKLIPLKKRYRVYGKVEHFEFTKTYKKHQVIRCFHVYKNVKVGLQCNYEVNEVFQHWINPKGKHAIRSVGVSYGYSCNIRWSYYGSMEIKKEHNRYYMDTIKYPNKYYLKELLRNGFNGDLHGYHTAAFIYLLLKNNKAETLLKTNQLDLFKSFFRYERKIFTYWNSIKICIRNNYKISDPSTWFDQVEQLEYFHKDIRSPKYVCPADLDKEHQKLIDKRRTIQRKEKLEEMKKEILTAEIIYKKEKGKYITISFENGSISIEVFQTVTQLMEESNILRHCAFQGKYHEKHDVIMFSAKVNGKPVETVEFSLTYMKVVQSRGTNNKVTDSHNEILKLIKKNIHVIKEVHRPKRKAKKKQLAVA